MQRNEKLTAPATEPVLKRGDSGPAVSHLQELLNACGPNLPVDGDFGYATLAAVISFQQKNRVSPTGVVDPHTWVTLRNVTQL